MKYAKTAALIAGSLMVLGTAAPASASASDGLPAWKGGKPQMNLPGPFGAPMKVSPGSKHQDSTSGQTSTAPTSPWSYMNGQASDPAQSTPQSGSHAKSGGQAKPGTRTQRQPAAQSPSNPASANANPFSAVTGAAKKLPLIGGLPIGG